MEELARKYQPPSREEEVVGIDRRRERKEGNSNVWEEINFCRNDWCVNIFMGS
jgi:hypothetical protein